MKHIWICQCGESGLGVEDYVKHMNIYNAIDEDFENYMNRKRTKEDIESLEEADKFYGDKQ